MPVQIADHPDEFLLWDDTHYSAAAHAVIGQAAFDSLPASLKPKTTTLVENASWRFFRGVSEPSSEALAWARPEFDDISWESGGAGCGFGDSEDLHFVDTQLTDMRNNYSKLYLRHSFDMEPSGVDSLLLHVDYDDDFIAYMNGVEVARSSFGEVGIAVPHDGESLSRSRDSSYREVFPIKLSDFPRLQVADDYVLAIQGINRRAADRDFVIAQIRLTAVVVPEPATLIPLMFGLLVGVRPFLLSLSRVQRPRLQEIDV